MKNLQRYSNLVKKKNAVRFLFIISFILFLFNIIFNPLEKAEGPPSNQAIYEAFLNKKSNVQVYGQGVIQKLLPDDNHDIRHQKIIVQLSENHTVLIAHNIDLAPRADVKKGEKISFYGEYEWNRKGGVVHWTHHDPGGKHVDGWIEIKGKKYQ